MRRRSAWLVVCALAASGQAQPRVPPAPTPFRITHYDVQLDPDLRTRTVAGTVTLSVAVQHETADTVVLNRGSLEIDSVHEDGQPRSFLVDGTRVRITLPPGHSQKTHTLSVAYHGKPASGLVFSAEREQIYTVFATSQWMVAADEPDARATLRLRLTIPADWVVAASGSEVSRQTIAPGRTVIEWRQDRPVPTYTFGFAAGRFSEATERAAGVSLRYLGGGFSDAELRRIFGESTRMIEFFQRRAGVPFPAASYTQALVARTVGREMVGLSVFSEEYGRAVLADPSAIGLIAHELAHQWWGNMVTCHAWTEFWLNEGFATFMAAAYREQRFGRETYLADIASMRARYEQVRDRGNDRALVFSSWARPTADDRTLVYQKGAYVLHQLRELLGDEVFWSGIRRYTVRHFGQSVTTGDFRAAMEEASGKDLGAFFDRWIFMTP